MIKMLELFGGIGSPRKALENLGVEYKSIDYVEKMPYAVEAYNQMFDNSYKPQLVESWNNHVDILVHGSPCQDWSNNGNNDVTTGRSILYERTLEIIKYELHPRPRVVIWENVVGLISKRHVKHFNAYVSEMENMGYTNSYEVLNSNDFNVPQNRERVFCVSILGDERFSFPKGVELKRTLRQYLDFDTDLEEYALTENEMSLFFEKDGEMFVRTNNKVGFKRIENFDAINVERPNSTTRRGRVGEQMVHTITTSPNQCVYYDGIFRRLSPLENWRLMGYSDEDFHNVSKKDIPKKDLYKLAGNSIVVQVMEAIFAKLLKLEVAAIA